MASWITEPERRVPVIAEVDVCVLGGSCTGVFAALCAARLGMRVAIIEKQNAFGGVATSGLVNVWHSLLDTEGKIPIIAGLTQEVIRRLARRGAVSSEGTADAGCRLNTEELKIELDELVTGAGVVPFLHTFYCAPVVEGGRIEAVLVENKDGRGAIRAGMFIDATGDGDLAAHVGLPFVVADDLQPPTTCAKVRQFWSKDCNFKALYAEHRSEFGLPLDWGWSGSIPGLEGIQMVAENHVFDTNAADARQLTRAEIEGRRQIRAVLDMVRKYGPQGDNVRLVALASYLGIRETRRFAAEHRLTEGEVLSGTAFPDAIAYGSYRVDVHHPDGGGFRFKYLDGTTHDFSGDRGRVCGRWRPETPTNPTFYQIPYRCLVNRSMENLILAGRMIGTDRGAYGAVRVMVNLNQTGEAAGAAAAIALRLQCHVADVPAAELRGTLAEGGSIMFG